MGMTMLRCLKCRKEFEMEDRVRCPFCGYRIIVKSRPGVVKRVVAR
jgi:DNA-directed RNA polymerase subunit P